jgi:hypothetical protein
MASTYQPASEAARVSSARGPGTRAAATRWHGVDVWSAVLILLVSTAGIVLSLQGWRSQAPAFDMLPYFHGVDAFLRNGAILQHGNLSSYGPFFPPGTFWLMLPGAIVFNDMRLFEKLGAGILYVGTVVGVFALARAAFGTWCARLCTVLYALSSFGLAFAGSLWPIGNPFFYVWMAYFAIEWSARTDPRFLSLALLTWAIGMNVGMAIAPAIFVVPVLWLLRRPPVRTTTLLLAGAAALLVWYPFLAFEVSREFVDVRSILTLHNIAPAPTMSAAAWCDPSLTLSSLDPGASSQLAAPPPPTSAVQRALARGAVLLDKLLAPFDEATPNHALGVLLAIATIAALIVLALAKRGRGPRRQLLAASLVVPWLIVLVVAEPGKPERFLWLAPLQVVVLAAIAAPLLSLRRTARVSRYAVPLVLGSVLLSGSLSSHVGAWLRNGWSGADAPQVQVADAMASVLLADGRDQAAIGYQLLFYPFMVQDHVIDPDYKVGAEFDAVLKYRDRITNTDGCAEGFSPGDEYRVIQDEREPGEGTPSSYFPVASTASFSEVKHVGSYRILRRVE